MKYSFVVRGAYYPLCSCRGPVLAELGHPDVAAEDICTSACIGIRGTLRSRRGCGRCSVVQYVRPVPSELGWGRLSRFSLLLGGLAFCVWGGEGCRVLVCCVVVSLVRAEAPVPSVATSGCPKRSEGGCPCRSEDVHRTSSQQCGRLKAYESPPPSHNSSGQSFQKVTRLQDRPNPRHKLTEILHILTLLQQANAKTGRNLSIILKRQIKRAAIH